MKAIAFLSTAAAFYFALALGSSAFAAQKGTDVRPEPPKAKTSSLTDGECTALGGAVKKVAVSIWCLSGQWCNRVDQNGKIISIGCVDGIKR